MLSSAMPCIPKRFQVFGDNANLASSNETGCKTWQNLENSSIRWHTQQPESVSFSPLKAIGSIRAPIFIRFNTRREGKHPTR